MATSAVLSQDLWSQDTPLRTGDVLNQIAHTLELLGYSKTVAALTKEASKQDVVVDTAEWSRAIGENTGVPLLELYELWLKKKKSLPTLPAAKEAEEDSSSSSSDPDSDSDESMVDSAEGGALVDVEAEETDDDSSDEESSASSSSSEEEEAAPVPEKKRKRVASPPSSSEESDADSSADEAPITKKAKVTTTTASSSASDSSSASSSASSSSESSSDSDSSSSDSSSGSSSSSSDDSSDSSSSSESDADAAPPPKKAKKAKKSKVEEVPEVAAVAVVEVKPKKEKKDKKDRKVKTVEAVIVEAPSSGSSATLEAESDAAENVQESSIHPSRLAQVPVVDLPAATRKQIAAEGKGAVIPFSRIPVDQKVDPRFASNAYVSYDYADRAHRDLVVTKGKGFTKEKNKKKRGAYRGGAIDLTPKGIKFDD